MRSYVQKIILLGLAVAFAGSALPERAASDEQEEYSIGEKVLSIAGSMIGTPYRYRGETPDGFDCSGLVRYSYKAAGIEVPRVTSGLKKATRHVDYADLRIGDLVFFDRNGKRYGHVGLYAGDGLFIHAPSRGKTVRVDSLEDPYWKKHFSGGRRF